MLTGLPSTQKTNRFRLIINVCSFRREPVCHGDASFLYDAQFSLVNVFMFIFDGTVIDTAMKLYSLQRI